MAIDFSLPTIARNFRTQVLQDVHAKANAIAKMLHGDVYTNLPVDTVRLNRSVTPPRFEAWNGTGWDVLVDPADYLSKAGNLAGLANQATARGNLSLGSIATQAANNVAITGGTISGITDLAVADGGTGSSTPAGARAALELGSMAQQAASAVNITGGSVAGIADLAVADGGTGASTAEGARTNLGAAASGANTDITSLGGLQRYTYTPSIAADPFVTLNSLAINRAAYAPVGKLCAFTFDISFVPASTTNRIQILLPNTLTAASNVERLFGVDNYGVPLTLETMVATSLMVYRGSASTYQQFVGGVAYGIRAGGVIITL